MPDQITPEIFKYLVDLASFELEPENQEYLRQQLNHQLKAIHELANMPSNGMRRACTRVGFQAAAMRCICWP